MSIYDDVDNPDPAGIYSGSDELVVPDWELKENKKGNTEGTGDIEVGNTVILCNKKTTKATLTKFAALV